MLCRVADDIFWMSRYVERAIAVGRLIDVVWHFELDAGEHDDTGDFWKPSRPRSPMNSFAVWYRASFATP